MDFIFKNSSIIILRNFLKESYFIFETPFDFPVIFYTLFPSFILPYTYYEI